MYQTELALAVRAVREAARPLKSRANLRVDALVGKDIKLSADKESEKIILEHLACSSLPVLSEECGFVGQQRDLYWIVDPIDGTLNYYRGMDELSCISVALWKDDEPLLGVVYRFFKDELFVGVLGEGAWLNDTPIHPSSIASISEAVMATGFPVKRSYEADSLQRFIAQVQGFKKVRMLGAAALMAVFVATGRIDAYFEEEIMLWDIAAAAAIVRAAGGTVEIEPLADYKCVCRCFATHALMEEYHAKGF